MGTKQDKKPTSMSVFYIQSPTCQSYSETADLNPCPAEPGHTLLLQTV